MKFSGFCKDSWHGDVVHVSGCDGGIYLAGECNEACKAATKNLKITREEIKLLPYCQRKDDYWSGRGDTMG